MLDIHSNPNCLSTPVAQGRAEVLPALGHGLRALATAPRAGAAGQGTEAKRVEGGTVESIASFVTCLKHTVLSQSKSRIWLFELVLSRF